MKAERRRDSEGSKELTREEKSRAGAWISHTGCSEISSKRGHWMLLFHLQCLRCRDLKGHEQTAVSVGTKALGQYSLIFHSMEHILLLTLPEGINGRIACHHCPPAPSVAPNSSHLHSSLLISGATFLLLTSQRQASLD